jgi:mono/diheme cytochrome c family protein
LRSLKNDAQITPMLTRRLHLNAWPPHIASSRPPGSATVKNPVSIHRLIAVLVGLALLQATAALAAAVDGGRGEMLYSNHCIACHTTEVHWRDQRLATDWNGLENQVRRWQRNTGLSWTEDDIASVAAHLNRLYYHFPAPGQEKAISLGGPGRRTPWNTIPDSR